VPFTRESLKAQVKLAEMNLREDTAKRWESAVPGLMQQTFADAYRSAIGIHPARRSELRTALEDLRDGKTEGDVTVEGIIGRLDLT
jgi:hypothetical protein